MPPNSFRSCQSQALATDNSVIGVLGLFPFLDDSGGIQRAGRLAWKGIVNRESPTANGELGRPYIFCYGTHTGDGRSETGNSQEAGLTSSPAREAIYTASKLKAAVAAAKWRQPVGLVLVWHVGLLRLLPFFRFREAKIALFLHGIGAWRPQGWLTRRLLRRVSLFLVNSEHTWERFLDFHPIFETAPHRRVNLGIDAPRSVAISAPSCGLPVIVTDNCGIPVPDSSWRVPIMNSDAIARRLTIYAEDRNLRREHGQIVATFARQFTPERYREQVKMIFRQLLQTVPA